MQKPRTCSLELLFKPMKRGLLASQWESNWPLRTTPRRYVNFSPISNPIKIMKALITSGASPTALAVEDSLSRAVRLLIWTVARNILHFVPILPHCRQHPFIRLLTRSISSIQSSARYRAIAIELASGLMAYLMHNHRSEICASKHLKPSTN